MRSTLGKSVILGWAPEAVAVEAGELREQADVLDKRGTGPRTALESLHESGGWRGDAQSSALSCADAESKRIEQTAGATRSLQSVVLREIQRLTAKRDELAQAVMLAEADGCVVDESWSISGDAVTPVLLDRHRREVEHRVVELNRCDVEAARSVARALEGFESGQDTRAFLPLAIGLALVVDAAVSALIAAGVVSIGAILFALVDEFGVDAWDTIDSAIPRSFFEDAGPVDENSVKDCIGDSTSPGRNPPIRQVENEQQLRDLWDTLTAEGRVVEDARYPGQVVELPDGTQVRLRESSRSGGPTMDINYPSGDKEKVHTA
ncbi:hypothetical protein [Rhodococcoides yunnanense]|uniref:hypothetical protein n=1 Tax=Rhodococcoides yunnanense TaxID=278209 RepID=UPI00093271CE|nr:hypothetical protein [Rhodococcus yunnanensis]